MSTPALYEIAHELNVRARLHPIGSLQEIRGHRPGNDLFRVNSNVTKDRWACHWGGRTELQFNIGLESGVSKLRYGVAFDFEPSFSYTAGDLLERLAPKVNRFNDFVRRHPEICKDMNLKAWDCRNEELAYDGRPGQIASKLVAKDMFIFLGKLQSAHHVDYELILDDFDRLLPLYQYVESHRERKSVSLPLETQFAFRPGCRTKKRSTIVKQSGKQIQRDLRHNELQKILYRQLARQYGKENVGTEVQGVNGTSIDLVVLRKRDYWFYEIKTAGSARACIREALGQILEYAFWPGAKEAARLFVAGECPLDQNAQHYLHCLNQRFSLRLGYEQIKV